MAQDEYAILVNAGCAVFLGDQIHSIFERCDEGDVARTIVREQFFSIQVAKMILHRNPVVRGETAVDVAYETVNAAFEFVILGNVYPARYDDLDQDDPAVQLRISLQRVAKCAEAFRNSLAVVQPVGSQD